MAASDGFLGKTGENEDLNQYWYSSNSIKAIADEVVDLNCKVAFLSTPSIYFSLPDATRKQCMVFDFDKQWESDPGFCFYDFNDPEGFPEEILHTFDAVVVDPPFITREVWEKYTISCKALLRVDPALRVGEEFAAKSSPKARSEGAAAGAAGEADTKSGPHEDEAESKDTTSSVPQALAEAAARGDAVIATTIHENAAFMQELLGVRPNTWQPSIPNLVYQYDLYTNYASQRFAAANPEIPSWDD